jgi:hypothetical protein
MGARRTPRRATIAATAAGMCLLAGASACSGSSSSGSGPSEIPTPSGPPPTSLHGHPLGGPNGVITAPAYNPPSSGVPGGSETFPNVDNKLDHQIFEHVLAMTGVAHIAYYPQLKQFQVYWSTDSTGDQRNAVYAYITKLT